MAKCSQCGAEVLHVRDDYTGGSFPVDAEPVQAAGFELGPPREGERNPRASRTELEVYVPHEQTCSQLAAKLDPADDEEEAT